MSETLIQLSKQVRELFSNYRNREPANPQAAYDGAQIAILNITQALYGLVPEKKIIAAIGRATTPNAASRALRDRLSTRYKIF